MTASLQNELIGGRCLPDANALTRRRGHRAHSHGGVENEWLGKNSSNASRMQGGRLHPAADPKQVLMNRESGVNQRALRERLLELGWKKNQVVLIDEDQKRSGKDGVPRVGFQALVADVSLRRVGIIMGYEVSRLSRNNAD